MARYSYYGRKISGYKWAIGIVTFLAIIAIGLCVITGGFKNWNAQTWFNNEPEFVCEHEFENGICIKCEMAEETCEHEFEDGACIKCEELEKVCEHEFIDGTCAICGDLELTE